MKKLFITGVLLCSVIILIGAQTGFAWDTYEGGCFTCHGSGFSSPLHTIHAGQTCTICHPGAAGATPIPTSTCAGCHPAADPGVCPLINAPAHAATQATCLACHTPISGCQAPVTTTTTVAESTTTTTTTEEPTTTTTTTPPAEEIEVSIDIKPGSCPNPIGFAGNRGVVPFAIMGTTDFDITQIDPESIRITREGVDAEVAPIRWTYEDVATPFEGELCDCDSQEYDGEYDSGEHDGQMDLLMKVYKYDLVYNLKLQEVAGETIPLTVTGKLKDEFGSTLIKGQDCVRVLKAVLKGNKDKMK
jgi:hypothetical protein